VTGTAEATAEGAEGGGGGGGKAGDGGESPDEEEDRENDGDVGGEEEMTVGEEGEGERRGTTGCLERGMVEKRRAEGRS
jgi:hypothetical protein